MGFAGNEEALRHIVCRMGVGGMMYRSGFRAEIQEARRKIQSMARVLLPLAAMGLNRSFECGQLCCVMLLQRKEG